MPTVHIFTSSGRFRSPEELRLFVDQAYSEDGDGIPSPFMREVGLSGYEPMCIECIWEEQPAPLSDLLDGASHSAQWIQHLPNATWADAVICVFEPNRLRHPEECSLEYCGVFGYKNEE